MKRSTVCYATMPTEPMLRMLVVVACMTLAACQRAGPDPESAARAVVAACHEDAGCVRERWQSGGDRSIGLRSEIAGQSARDLFVVETTREIAAPDSGSPPCASRETAGIYYRTTLAAKDAPGPPLAIFRWDGFESALAGHRRVAAVGVEARGDAAELRRRIEAAADLDRACAWIAGARDRCAA